MSKSKLIRRFISTVLSAQLLVCIMPVSALTDASEIPVDTSSYIVAFEELAADVAVQSVPLGTAEADLKLPESLTATIQIKELDDIVSSDLEEPPSDTESESEETISDANSYTDSDLADDANDELPSGTESESEETISDANSYTDSDLADDANDELPSGTESESEETISDANSYTDSDLADDANTDTSPAQPENITVPVSISWTSSPKYDGTIEGEYLFLPELPEGSVLADEVELPQIIVTVFHEVLADRTVSALEELADEIRWQNSLEPVFPKTLPGVVNGEAAEIPVMWQADHEYNKIEPEQGLYVFTAHFGDGYILEEAIEAPIITVFIPERISLMRMGGSGNQNSPLEVINPHQLREIAVLVNNRRLEVFLFNDANAKVYIKLMNDIDLSMYGSNYNDEKGWDPIGFGGYIKTGLLGPAFQGDFDGGGHTITGLYIKNREYPENQNYYSVGLFGCLYGGTVRNLNVSNASVHGDTQVGIIAGLVSSNGSIKNCSVSGTVNGAALFGGVVGSTAGLIENCSANCTVGTITSSSNSVGGIAGMIDDCTVRFCYATGVVEGSSSIGGIVGYIVPHSGVGVGKVEYCLALQSKVSGITRTEVGRVVGFTFKGQTNVFSFAGMECNGSGTYTVDGSSKAFAQLQTASGFPSEFTKSPWTYSPGSLPGLFGQPAEMPSYLSSSGGYAPYGSGTAASPYLINTEKQLYYVSNQINNGSSTYQNAHYQLTSDIDLSAYKSGSGWTSIGNSTYPFKGDFNGSGYTITDLYINRTSTDDVGLFGYINGGTIRNLGIIGANISVRDYAGILAGRITNNSTVKNCFTAGTITGNTQVGGIVGSIGVVSLESSPNNVMNCYSTATVNGFRSVGGIAGVVLGSMQNCYSTGAVKSDDTVGGLAGRVYGSIENSAALNPSVTATTTNSTYNIGRIAGLTGAEASCAGNVAFSGISVTVAGTTIAISDGNGNNRNGADKSSEQLILSTGFPTALITSPWRYFDGGLPMLTDEQGNLLRGQTGVLPMHIDSSYFAGGDGSESSPYLISNSSQLAKLAELINAANADYNTKHYRLIDNIDLTGYSSGEGWNPIGNFSAQFKGSFDGNGNTISNLYINRTGETGNYQSLFGYIGYAVVKNLGVVNANVAGRKWIGGISGNALSSTIQNCFATGNLTGDYFTGGISGNASFTTIKSCYTLCDVKGIRYSGGISGLIDLGAIQDCYTLGVVGKTLSGFYHSYSGGITGSSSSATINNCYVAGLVKGDMEVGGVAGEIEYEATIQNCVMLGSAVTGMKNEKIGRVAAVVSNSKVSDPLSGNYAFAGISGGGAAKTHDGNDGEDLLVEQINDQSFWQSTVSFSSSAWSFESGKLPVLKDTGGTQSGHAGLHLNPRDISKAGILLKKDRYPYTGCPIQPEVELTFDGATLKHNVDYILSAGAGSTSDGTNAGNATATIIGKGNFAGTGSIDYIIEKMTPTESHLQYTLANVTYNGLAQGIAVSIKSGFTGMGAITVKYNASTTIPVNRGTYAVTVQIGSGTNFNATVSDIALGSFTINKAPGEFGSPASVSATYSPMLRLGDIALADGYVWVSPSISLNAGNGQRFEAIYTPPNSNFESVAGMITVDVAKAKGYFETTSSISAIYSPALKLEDIIPPTGYVWIDPTILLSAGNGQSFEAIYTHVSGNYDDATGTIIVNVAKAKIDFIPLEPISVVYSPWLSLGSLPLSENYAWQNPAKRLNAGDNQSHQATYSHPSGNYEAFGNITVNVAKAERSFGHYPIRTTYSPTLKLRDLGLLPNFSWVYPDTSLQAGARQEHEAIDIDPHGNYLPATGLIWVIVEKATPSLTLAANPASTQTRPGSVELSAVLPDDATGTLTFKAGSETIATVTLPNKTAIFKSTGEENTFTFTVTYGGNSNYNAAASGIIEYSFTKSDQFLSAMDSTTNYGNRLDLLPLVSGNLGTGAVRFTVTDGPGEIDGTTLIAAGLGVINIAMTKDADHDYNAASAFFKITVNPRVIEFNLSPIAHQLYTGIPITPEPVVHDGDAILTKDEDFTVSYDNNTTIGSNATITITGIGKYEGSFGSMKFTIYIPESNDNGSENPQHIFVPSVKLDQSATIGISVAAQVNNGIAVLNITDSLAKAAILKAKADSKANGSTSDDMIVNASVTAKSATGFKIILDRTALDRMIDNSVKRLSISNLPVNIRFDSIALKKIQSQSSGDITITVMPTSAAGMRSAYQISISSTKHERPVTISSFGTGKITICIKTSTLANELGSLLYGAYLGNDGKTHRIATSFYDEYSKRVVISTNHLSVYGVGYTVPSVKMPDISSHWAKDSIEYIVENGLLHIGADGKFSPDAALTRADLAAALGKLEKADSTASIKNRFTDVTTDPAVTREEIALILQNFIKAAGHTLPATRKAIYVKDYRDIGSPYKTAVLAMQNVGILMGKQNNMFYPKAKVTRAEVCAMLHRLIKLSIDPSTSQGWTKNDHGQYLYYKSGIPVSGWHIIDGIKYNFLSSGALQTAWVKDGDNWAFYSGNTRLFGWWDIGSNAKKQTYYFSKDGIILSKEGTQTDGK